MTVVETQKIVNILLTADGGCPNCVTSLLLQFADAFDISMTDMAKLAATEMGDEEYWLKRFED